MTIGCLIRWLTETRESYIMILRLCTLAWTAVSYIWMSILKRVSSYIYKGVLYCHSIPLSHLIYMLLSRRGRCYRFNWCGRGSFLLYSSGDLCSLFFTLNGVASGRTPRSQGDKVVISDNVMDYVNINIACMSQTPCLL